ncbi:hypothetical protein J6590_056451 [Homalodisca vitripennis]|nr:hypothetical protein J6590_056451 [Homalodisca vitripennis]
MGLQCKYKVLKRDAAPRRVNIAPRRSPGGERDLAGVRGEEREGGTERGRDGSEGEREIGCKKGREEEGEEREKERSVEGEREGVREGGRE